ncbi:glycosyltransferase [Streptacidiphilus monticola]|uniref:Glycosyltransferase n=1 Tax=Streptacidiphilus monticola TaxID=2161674 RepID=A0ABW1G5D1_9ACTN
MKSSVVSIVVVSWNSAAVLPGLLETLADGMAGTDWQFVLADNASADDSVAVVRAALPDARIVQTGRNAGYAAAINAAVAEVRPEGPVLVLNPDIRLRPGFGKALLAGLEAEPGTGIAAPRLLGADGSVTPTLRREPSLPRAVGEAVLGNIRAGRFPLLGEIVTDPDAYTRPTRADWSTGAALLVSAECAAACGPWDESFFLYSEETEYQLRARDRGFATRLVPGAVAVHLEGESEVSPRLWTLVVLNKVRLYRRRHGRMPSALFRLALLVREVSRGWLVGHERSRVAARALVRPIGPVGGLG